MGMVEMWLFRCNFIGERMTPLKAFFEWWDQLPEEFQVFFIVNGIVGSLIFWIRIGMWVLR